GEEGRFEVRSLVEDFTELDPTPVWFVASELHDCEHGVCQLILRRTQFFQQSCILFQGPTEMLFWREHACLPTNAFHSLLFPPVHVSPRLITRSMHFWGEWSTQPKKKSYKKIHMFFFVLGTFF